MIPIIYCGNDKIFEGVFLSAVSVAKRTSSDIEVIVLTMDYTEEKPTYTAITDEHISVLDKAVKTFNPKSRARKVDLREDFLKTFPGGKNMVHSYTPYALLRLFLDDEKIVSGDKAIYLDIDTMACGNIEELWSIDLGDAEYGGALDYLGKFWVARDYLNSGVLLLNLKKMRENNMFAKCRDMVYNKWMAMPDQSALYNTATKMFRLDTRFNEQRDIKPDTVIKHFNRGIKWFPFFHLYNVKQWERDKVHSQLKITFFDEDYKFFDEFTAKNVD